MLIAILDIPCKFSHVMIPYMQMPRITNATLAVQSCPILNRHILHMSSIPMVPSMGIPGKSASVIINACAAIWLAFTWRRNWASMALRIISGRN